MRQAHFQTMQGVGPPGGIPLSPLASFSLAAEGAQEWLDRSLRLVRQRATELPPHYPKLALQCSEFRFLILSAALLLAGPAPAAAVAHGSLPLPTGQPATTTSGHLQVLEDADAYRNCYAAVATVAAHKTCMSQQRAPPPAASPHKRLAGPHAGHRGGTLAGGACRRPRYTPARFVQPGGCVGAH